MQLSPRRTANILAKARPPQPVRARTTWLRPLASDQLERQCACDNLSARRWLLGSIIETRIWCPGPDSNRYGVSSEGFSYQLQLSLLSVTSFVVWTFSSPYLNAYRHLRVRQEPSSLYTFLAGLGEAWGREIKTTRVPVRSIRYPPFAIRFFPAEA
jgi:hypothetical protein